MFMFKKIIIAILPLFMSIVMAGIFFSKISYARYSNTIFKIYDKGYRLALFNDNDKEILIYDNHIHLNGADYVFTYYRNTFKDYLKFHSIDNILDFIKHSSPYYSYSFRLMLSSYNIELKSYNAEHVRLNNLNTYFVKFYSNQNIPNMATVHISTPQSINVDDGISLIEHDIDTEIIISAIMVHLRMLELKSFLNKLAPVIAFLQLLGYFCYLKSKFILNRFGGLFVEPIEYYKESYEFKIKILGLLIMFLSSLIPFLLL